MQPKEKSIRETAYDIDMSLSDALALAGFHHERINGYVRRIIHTHTGLPVTALDVSDGWRWLADLHAIPAHP